MKISFLIPAIVLYLAKTVFTNNTPVGTVLFTTTDLVKKCWTDNDKALLRARLIMQDVIPEPESLDFSKPNAVSILLDYFQACYEIVSSSTYGNIQNLMLIALSDAIGGYLRAYVLPLTRQAYYAGKVKYGDAKQLFTLYDDIRIFLKTNGVGWANPQKLCNIKYKLQPIVVGNTNSESACEQLYTIEKMGELHCITPKSSDESKFANKPNAKYEKLYKGSPQNSYNQKFLRNNFKNNIKYFDSSKECANRNLGRSRQELRQLTKRKVKSNSEFKEDSNKETPSLSSDQKNFEYYKTESNKKIHNLQDNEEESFKKLIIPLPVLDDSETPHSIAVPFKVQPLRNLKSRTSAYVLEHYYTTVVKCLTSNHNSKRDIRNFNGLFNTWLTTQVCPRLKDEEWYPAFGGVLRVMETIKKTGLSSGLKSPASDDIAFMFSKGLGVEEYSDLTPKGRSTTREVKCEENCSRRYVMYSVIIVTAILIVIFCMAAFYYQATRAKYKSQDCKKDCNQGKDDKILNVEFLIKFFKKNNENGDDKKCCSKKNDWREDSFQTYNDYDDRSLDDNRRKYQMVPVSKEQANQAKKKGESKQKGELVLTGQGDVPAFIISGAGEPEKHFKPQTIPVYTIKAKTKNVENEKVIGDVPAIADAKEDTKHSKKHSNFKEQNEKVQTLWKKPSAWFHKTPAPKRGLKNKKEPKEVLKKPRKDVKHNTVSDSCTISAEDGEKVYSTEKRSSCCSGSCTHTNETTTISTLQTQVDDTMSSRVEGVESRMEFFDRVVGRHKTSRKSPVQESSGDTDSEGEDSYSSESD